ncbi:hypothetical protein [Vibrio cholerae]|uniref:hypothetical protein n=2 Tax=Vibrio cholerae TaxID=666 RepID=UPI0028310AB5|nr:hypothetical protein [Vibrio cholerae]ELC9567731.1 hypothetical protein [Vibrio cholerae]ELK8282311.1 hypothetical protein [Vibrio cholerae]BER96849.1 hypothetical protein VNVC001_31700 [Vibrio cholerae]
MDYFSDEIIAYKGLLQGDLFKINNKGDSPFLSYENYAVLITADCDLANPSKNVNYYTFLPIISSSSYIEKIWIPEYLEKKVKNKSNELSEYILKNKIHELKGCNPISGIELYNWVKESGIYDIVTSLELNKEEPKIKNTIKILELIECDKKNDIYFKINEIENNNSKKISSDLKSAISQSKEEFYILPLIDKMYDSPSVITLRMIRPIHKSYVFTNEIDARQSIFNTETNLVRIGRFSDYLRYSISQRFAYLFSRIGMPEDFEVDVDESINIFVDEFKDYKK